MEEERAKPFSLIIESNLRNVKRSPSYTKLIIEGVAIDISLVHPYEHNKHETNLKSYSILTEEHGTKWYVNSLTQKHKSVNRQE